MTATKFKTITAANLPEPDPLTMAFSNLFDSVTGETRQMSRDEFLAYILEPPLVEPVPLDIRTLIEGARGAMCYGYFFYPLFMVGVEQLFRTAEAAARHRARQLGGPWSSKFSQVVEFLVAQGTVPETDKDRWDHIRRLRNEASHPKFQQVMTPGPCVDTLVMVVDAINQLFSAGRAGTEPTAP
jgi:hypothetical protein